MSTASLSIEQGDWRRLGEQAGEIRRRVFIDEQAVPQEEEWDGRDDECLHFLVRLDGDPVGTARLLPDGHIGRVAVLAAGRGRGIGLALMQAAIEAARERGHAHAELAAQTHALAFYRRLGFEAYGAEFMDAGIPHRNMRLDLTR
ncbi:GNAT family N-acetyltransferase [Halomonas sp. HP20-15]|uniref:GNAT family N-acetyltransferase n=1 Tax=Halomonas sp. HP20-15 TaxID=3085901 RepID=UPI002980A40D|nr:GNAT family N-acetyltransferase [Halomonas sp. HP20-15]MDW5376975.1 GNAT family N-acetyltransferase [Halomonas sp. HP20-15]